MKVILREESEQSKKKGTPLYAKVKKLQNEIKEYDSFKVEVHNFDVMALDELKFLQLKCKDKFRYVLFRFNDEFSPDGYGKLK